MYRIMMNYVDRYVICNRMYCKYVCVCQHILSHMHTCALRCLVPFSVAGVEKQKWHHVGVFERMLKRHPLFSLSCSGFKQAFGLCRKP